MKRFLHVAMAMVVSALGSMIVGAPSMTSANATITPSLGVLVGQDQYVAGIEGSVVHFTVSSRDLPMDGTASIAITSYRPVRTREAVREAMSGDLPSVVDTVLVPATEVARDGAGYLDIQVAIEIAVRSRANLQMSAVGVHPITIGVVVDKQVVDQIVTFVERLPEQMSAPAGRDVLQVALVSGLSGPLTLRPDGTTVVDEAALARTERMITAIEDSDMVPLTLLVSPEWIDAIERLGDDSAELLARINALQSVQVLSTSYVDVDVDELVALESPSIFLEQLRRGEDVLRRVFPSANMLRDTFLATRGLSAGSVTLLREAGFRSIVLGPRAQSETAEGASLLADPSRLIRLDFPGGSVDAALADPLMSLTVTEGSRTGADAYLAAQHLFAELRVIREEFDGDTAGRTVVVGTVDGAPPSAEFVESLISSLSTDPDIMLLTLDDAMRSTNANTTDDGPVVLALPTAESTDVNSEELASIDARLRARIDSFARMLPDGDVRVEMWRRVLEIIPEASLSDAQRRTYVEAVDNETANLARAITLPASTTFTLGGRDSSIRIALRNDSDSDLRVSVRLSSSKLRFGSQDDAVLLPAGTTTSVEVPVQARSNGRFPVVLQLFTPDGAQALGSPVTFTARVNALAGLGQLVTGIGLLLLISWWAHHLRRERRRRSSEMDGTATRHPSLNH
jgi:hypothetical protein